MSGFSLHVFLPAGDPEGLRIVSRSHWTGAALMAPRDVLLESLERQELGRAGVYLLLGVDEESPSGTRVYVGEGDPVRERLKGQDFAKEFWNHAIVFTKSDGGLNKAHIRYLEARLIGLAATAGRAQLENRTRPSPRIGTEAEEADLERFLEDMLVILRLLGVTVFDASPDVDDAEESDEVFELAIAEVWGRGRPTRDGFLVRAGSKARRTDNAAITAGQRRRRAQLQDDGVLEDDGSHLVFRTDHELSSSSMAASVLFGGPASGPQSWRRVADGRSLKEIEELRLEEIQAQQPEGQPEASDAAERAADAVD